MSSRSIAKDGDDEVEKQIRNVEKIMLVVRVIVILPLFSYGASFTYNDVVKYLAHETVTASTYELLRNVTFPAVTICNYNRWKNSTVPTKDKPMLEMMAAAELSSLRPDIPDDAPDLVTDGELHPHVTEAAMSTTTPATRAHRTKPAPGSGFNMYNFTQYHGWQLTDNLAWDSSGSPNGTLLSCSFRGVDCNVYFFSQVTTAYGNCYSFNKDIDWNEIPGNTRRRFGDKLIQTVPSENTGLSISLNIEAWDYYENVGMSGNEQVGVKVIVHSPDRLPDPKNEGIPVSPGFKATIPVTWSEYNYLEPPYGDCNKSKKLDYFDMYTYDGCLWECKKKKVKDVCNCVIYYQATEPNGVCDLGQSRSCAFSILAEISQNPESNCDCPVSCTEENYEPRAFYAKAPSPDMARGLAAKYNMTENFYGDNVVSFTVYISDMSRLIVSQQVAMDINQIIANAGGQLGLFAGFSFLTFLELIEFAIEECYIKKKESSDKDNKVAPLNLK